MRAGLAQGAIEARETGIHQCKKFKLGRNHLFTALSGISGGDPLSPPEGGRQHAGACPNDPLFYIFFTKDPVSGTAPRGEPIGACITSAMQIEKAKPSGGGRTWPHRTFSPQIFD